MSSSTRRRRPPWDDEAAAPSPPPAADEPHPGDCPQAVPPWHDTGEGSDPADRAPTDHPIDLAWPDEHFPPSSGDDRYHGAGISPAVDVSAPPRPPRMWPRPLIGAAVLSVALGAFLLGRATAPTWDGQTGLAVEHRVPRGMPVTAADLTPVFVALRGGDAGAIVPADRESAAAGRIAAVDLPAGAVLRSSDVAMPAP